MSVRIETWDFNPITGEYEVMGSWPCRRGCTSHWGCPTILKRVIETFGLPDVCFGKTDGIPDGIVTVDSNPDVKPTIVAGWENIPVSDGCWKYGFWDPPYDSMYIPSLNEILRVVSHRLIILHQIIYPNPIGWKKHAIIGVTTGPKMRIRALQIYDRLAQPLNIKWGVE